MPELFPQCDSVMESMMMSRADVLPCLTRTAVLVGSMAGVKADDPCKGFVFKG